MDHSTELSKLVPTTSVPYKLSVEVYHVVDVGGKDLTLSH